MFGLKLWRLIFAISIVVQVASMTQATGDAFERWTRHTNPNKTDKYPYYEISSLPNKDTWYNFKSGDGSIQVHRDETFKPLDVNLSFAFPFYGYETNTISIEFQGGICVGCHGNELTANTRGIQIFPTMLGVPPTAVSVLDTESAVIIQWANTTLIDEPLSGQVTILKSGDIYISIVSTDARKNIMPEEMGCATVSDSYKDKNGAQIIYSRISYSRWRQTAYLKPLTTCGQFHSCENCRDAPPRLGCVWCGGRCSNGWDRDRTAWISSGCQFRVYSSCYS